MTNLDLSSWSLQDLDKLEQRISEERAKRDAEEFALMSIDNLVKELAESSGRDLSDFAIWVQPTGAHDSYPAQAVVTHNGKAWKSLLSANVWEPGVSGWVEQAPQDQSPEEPFVPEWVQPTGAHDAYQLGDVVLFEGQMYESLMDNNTWSPADYPAGWQLVEEEV